VLGLRRALACLALVAFLACTLFAQEKRVRSVTVTGATGEDLVAAERVIRLRAGDVYSQKAVQDDVIALLGLNFVQSAKASESVAAEGVDVVYEISARGRVTAYHFAGNRKFKTKKLLKEGNLEGLKSYDPGRLNDAKELITAKYKKAGYLFVKVDWASQDDGSVLFKIDEGPRLKVTTVNVIGNTAFDDAVLKKQIQTKTRRYLILAYRFDQETAEDDRLRLQEYYRDHGYLDAQCHITLGLTKNGKGIIVDYAVTEGQLYRVRSVTVAGNVALSASQVEAVLKMTKDTAFSASRMSADVRMIRAAYGRKGYIDAEVAATPVFAAGVAEVDVTYRVDEGGPITVGEVDIFGNDKTRDNVIRRELEFYPGQAYDTDKVKESRDNLLRLSWFNKVEITQDQAARGTNPRNATVTVDEMPTGRFVVGIAVNSNAGLMGNLQFEQRNFDYRTPPRSLDDLLQGRAWSGGGQYFTLDAMPGTELSRYRMYYKDPRVADSDYSLGLDLHYWQRQFETYTETRTGGEISVGRKLTKYAFDEVGLTLERVKIGSIDDDAPDDVKDVRGPHQVHELRYTIGHDTRDNYYIPTTGHRLAATVEGSTELIGSDFDFTRWRLEGNWYTTAKRDKLDRPYVVCWRGRLGYMWPESSRDDPIFERYFLGGAYDVRGFEYRGIGPRFGNEPLGGKFTASGGVEYDFPLAGEYFRGAVFYDAGTLLTEAGDLSFGEIRHAVGFGIRFTIPPPFNFPVSLDFGFPVKKKDTDETQVISFTFGRPI